MTLFFDLQFLGVLHIVEENFGHVWNQEEILSQEDVHCAVYAKNFDLQI